MVYRRQLAETEIKSQSFLNKPASRGEQSKYKIDLLTCEILRSNIGKAKSFLIFG